MKFLPSLAKLQKELNCPKGQYNNFGKYSYRNAEDILEACKPLLHDATITLDDDIVLIGERYYVKATAFYSCEEGCLSRSAFAREPLNKKGMDEAQITGATSSYARKYALSALLLIDDNKDADSSDNSEQEKKPVPHHNAQRVMRIVASLKLICKDYTDDQKKELLINTLKVRSISELYNQKPEELDAHMSALRFLEP